MSTQFLLIEGSHRQGGNTETAGNALVRACETQGHTVTRIALRDTNIAFCKGCETCVTRGACILDDDMPRIIRALAEHSVIVLTTPVYFCSVSSRMKQFIDRFQVLWTEQRRNGLALPPLPRRGGSIVIGAREAGAQYEGACRVLRCAFRTLDIAHEEELVFTDTDAKDALAKRCDLHATIATFRDAILTGLDEERVKT